jgi:hypothetical protein
MSAGRELVNKAGSYMIDEGIGLTENNLILVC